MKYESSSVKVLGSLADLTQSGTKTLFKTYDGLDFSYGPFQNIPLSS